jgi:hypothetical protein
MLITRFMETTLCGTAPEPILGSQKIQTAALLSPDYPCRSGRRAAKTRRRERTPFGPVMVQGLYSFAGCAVALTAKAAVLLGGTGG